MAPKKRATKAATESAESTTPTASQETPSTSQPVAVASPAASQTPDAVAEASPSKAAAGRRSASAAATVKPAATTVDEASPPKKQHHKAPPAFIDVLVADNIAPAALGAVDMALTADEGTLVVARSNGSLAAYRVLPGPDPEKPIFNFVMVANTGGHANCGISKIALLGAQDEYVVVALCSGQIALYHTVSLTLAGISPRVGGVIRSIARSGPTDFFAACADGSARRFKINESGDGVVVAMTVPKSISCERALSVAVSTKLGLVVVGDDARTITAFELGPLTAKHMTQKWHMQLPNGYPMAMAISETGNAIAVGTSMNEVLFIDPTIGLVVNTYQHHKGPVTVVLEAAGVFYSSGWHESLRAYRAAAASSTNGARPTPATRATAKISASDYCPAEVKRRTHYHECVALAVGLRTGLFLSAARDGTVMFTNLDKLFTHPASYLDSQVSKTPYELCGAGHLLFTHRDAVVHVYRVLPTHLLPLASISLSGDFNVRGVWPNASGTWLCVATDERLIVVALDANLENNTCKVRRLATEAIAEVSSACFPSEHVCCAAVANRLVLIACDDETVNSVAEASRKLHTARRNRALQHRRVRDDQDDDAGAEATTSTTAVKTVYSAPRIQGHIHTMVAASVTNQSCVFVATTAPAAYHFVRLDKHDQSFVDPPSVDATDCVSVRALHTSGDVSFLCPTDGRHWIVKAPTDVGKGFDVLLKKPASLTVARSLLPQNAIALGRYPENPTMCAAAFPNGIVQFQANGERWSYIRQADRAKAEAHNIKTKTEFASMVPSTTTVSPPWAAQPNNSRNKALGLPRKVHRAEAATIALEGQDSDAEGSDDGRGEDPTQLAEGVRERRSDAIFVLRRNIEGMLEGLPNMWRVRRFGN